MAPQGRRAALASVSPSLQWGPSSWSPGLPPQGRKPHPAAPSLPQPSGGPAQEPHRQPEEGGARKSGQGGAHPQPRARRRRGRRLPPETRCRCARRCQHSWKVTPGQAGGGGTAPARCQMCIANSCPRLIRSAPGSGEPRTHPPPPPAWHPRRRASRGGRCATSPWRGQSQPQPCCGRRGGSPPPGPRPPPVDGEGPEHLPTP